MSPTKNDPAIEKFDIQFSFREKLNSVAEGFRHNYCYQCGACVADCPANNYDEHFNPRLIMLKAILGFEEELLGADSEIWNCTNCYTCSERCPQDVRPIDVIIALKNLSVLQGNAPPIVGNIYNSVLQTGTTTKSSSLVDRRRKELGLSPLGSYPIDEIQKILKVD
ncbi:MAG: 4Fe-4S dicluster domain-containing protein [candidate division Zixibacteria bacterium]|nr:4Fe-4S dicluster domain-containing protein [candidate division Zixibacteria bacterium]